MSRNNHLIMISNTPEVMMNWVNTKYLYLFLETEA